MTFQFTPSGLEIDTFDEIYTRISDGLKVIYGSDINLDQNSPDGQRVGIIVKAILDGQSFAQLLYSQLDADFSFGTFQDVMFKINGLTRREPTESTVDVTINVSADVDLQIGYTVRDELSQNWVTKSVYSLLAGDNSVTLFSERSGSFSADANTVTNPVTIVQKVNSVTNPLPATPGQDEESEPDFRLRRRKSFSLQAGSGIGKIISAIGEVNGVTDVVAYANDTDVDEPDLPARTEWVIVEGGDNAEIAEAYAKSKAEGIPMQGAVTAQYIETITRPNGAPFVITHEMKFDRPSPVTLHVKVNAKRKFPTSPIDLNFIAKSIASKVYVLSEDAVATELYSFGYQAGTDFFLTDLEISDDGVTFTDELLSPGRNGKFDLLQANVTVTEI